MEELDFTLMVVCQILSKYCANITPTTSLLLISAHISDSLWKLESFRKKYKAMDINSDDETSYTTYYQEAYMKYVEN